MWWKGHLTLGTGTCQGKLQSCQVSPSTSWLISTQSTPADEFGDHRSYKNGDINCYINSYMDTLEKADRIISIRHIAGILKLRIRNSGYRWQKKKKEVKKSTGNCKVLCVSGKRKKCSTIGTRISKYWLERELSLA